MNPIFIEFTEESAKWLEKKVENWKGEVAYVSSYSRYVAYPFSKHKVERYKLWILGTMFGAFDQDADSLLRSFDDIRTKNYFSSRKIKVVADKRSSMRILKTINLLEYIARRHNSQIK